MRIVLDTNILYGDWWLRKTSLHVLASEAQKLRSTIWIPSVVFDEVCNKYREECVDLQKQSETLLKRMKRICRPSMDLNEPMAWDKAVTTYPDQLSNRLKETGIKLLPYPSTAHQQVVKRALARRLPFRDHEKGYRDTLIWETVKSLAREKGFTVVFVSQNTSDFAKNGALHPDLRMDFVDDQLGPDCIRFFASLEDLIEQEVKPTLERHGLIRQQLSDDSYEHFNIHKWVQTEDFDDLCASGPPLPLHEEHMYGKYREIEMIGLHAVLDATATDVQSYGDRHLLIEAEAVREADCWLVDRWDRLQWDEVTYLLKFNFAITLNVAEHCITSAELRNVEFIEDESASGFKR